MCNRRKADIKISEFLCVTFKKKLMRGEGTDDEERRTDQNTAN